MPVVSVPMGFTHPRSRALTDWAARFSRPEPSPGEAWPAPPAPGRVQAPLGRAWGGDLRKLQGGLGSRAGLGPRGQELGVVDKREHQESQEVAQLQPETSTLVSQLLGVRGPGTALSSPHAEGAVGLMGLR